MALMSSLVHCGTKIYESASALIRLWYVKSSLRSHLNDGYYRQNKYTYFKIILVTQVQKKTRLVVDRDNPLNSFLDWVSLSRVPYWTSHYHFDF